LKNSLDLPVLPITRWISWRDVLTAAVVSITYLVVSALLIGFKTDQLFLVLIFDSLYLASRVTRKFILGFSVFIVFWILYDYMKAFPNYVYNTVHIQDLYNTERSLFGMVQDGKLVTPNEYFRVHSAAWVDVLTGFFYLCWIPVPLGFAAYLFFKDRSRFLQFLLTFLLVNLLGFVVYYLYPAAPPWYVQEHGFDFIAGTPGNTAGLIRFDQFFGVTIFQSLYQKGSNVFAAMPSLHSAYPLIVFYTAWKARLRAGTIVFGIITVGIWFAAVYTSHHYILDVLAGITTATAGITLFQQLLKHQSTFRTFVERYTQLIS
jgi:inositol phosphorylceramide synthase catalytic subunit